MLRTPIPVAIVIVAAFWHTEPVCAWFDTADSVDGTQAIDFARDVRPILVRSCLRCHGPDRQSGGLRLDEKDFVDRGGHTGNPILGSSPDDSELYQRISSNDDRYRMPPPDEKRLTAPEQETIRRWLEQGGRWSDDAAAPTPSSLRERFLRFYDREIEQFDQQVLVYVRRMVWPLAVWLLFVLAIERIKRGSNSGDSPSATTRGRVRTLTAGVGGFAHLFAVSCFVIAGMWMARGDREKEIQPLNDELNELRSRLTQNRQSSSDPIASYSDETGGPIPYRPKHPPRIGGEYYRGNDERNAKLFNGGHYRTATFRLSLIDQDGNALDYDAELTDRDLSIRLEIERAAYAVPALFADRIMKNIHLSKQVQGPQGATEAVDTPCSLREIEPGERWEAVYPIGSLSNADSEPLADYVYVYMGKVEDGLIAGGYHYAIRYELRSEQGRLVPESELWLGSLYGTGALFVPPQDRLAAHEWFSFQPIPEIDSENSTDPDLLGIPEHLPDFGLGIESDSDGGP